MPLEKSALIWRKSLCCLSGGKNSGKKQQNPLQLATPISYMGGRSLATKDKFVIHITIKEECNVPLPKDSNEDLVLWRIGKTVNYDIKLLAEKSDNEYKHSVGIPLFWEPSKQKDDDTKVQYCGHWKVSDVKFEQKVVMKQPRCGSMTFKFDRYDERFSRIIAKAANMTEAEIAKHDWDSALEEKEEGKAADGENNSKVKDEKETTQGSSKSDPADTVAGDASSIKSETTPNLQAEAKSDVNDEKPTARASDTMDESQAGDSSQGATADEKKKAPKTEEQAAMESEHGTFSKKKETRAHCVKPEQKPEMIVTGEASFGTTGAPKKPEQRKNKARKQCKRRRHNRDTSEEERVPHYNPAAARVVEPSAGTAVAAVAPRNKRLAEFTADELAELIANNKGKRFEQVAEKLKSADFNGRRIVEQMEKGDDHFLEFLRRYYGLDMLLCGSLLRALKDKL